MVNRRVFLAAVIGVATGRYATPTCKHLSTPNRMAHAAGYQADVVFRRPRRWRDDGDLLKAFNEAIDALSRDIEFYRRLRT